VRALFLEKRLVCPPATTAVLSRRDRVIISSCLVLLTALAWTYLFHLDRQMSAAMAHDPMMADMAMTLDMPWNAVDIFFTFAMWAVMMVGMMTASTAPVLLLFVGMHRTRGAPRAPRAVFFFSAGYLLVWTGFQRGRCAGPMGAASGGDAVTPALNAHSAAASAIVENTRWRSPRFLMGYS
jgi:predicted metal-binding membrane protein